MTPAISMGLGWPRMLLSAVLLGAMGCPAPAKPPEVVTKPTKTDDDSTRRMPTVEYELGGISPDILKARFAGLQPKFLDCYKASHTKNEALSGGLKMTVRTRKDGTVKWAYLKQSDLGDRVLEKCILELVRETNWGKPMDAKEGEIAEHAIRWENDSEDEEAHLGPMAAVEPSLDRARSEIAKCRGGKKAKFVTTIYIQPKGKPRAVGIATDAPEGEDVADCIVRVLEKLTYVNKSSQLLKVTIAIP